MWPLTSFSRRQLCGDEQWNGKKPRDVLDCIGNAALAIDSGTLRIQSEHDFFATQWLREALRNVLDW